MLLYSVQFKYDNEKTSHTVCVKDVLCAILSKNKLDVSPTECIRAYIYISKNKQDCAVIQCANLYPVNKHKVKKVGK